MTKKVNAAVTKMFIDRVNERREAGENVVAPWAKPWDTRYGANRNLKSNKAYRGSNTFITAIQGYSSPLWVTNKQAIELGGSINRTDDGKLVAYTPIVFWYWPTDEERARGRFPSSRYSQVFNVEQTTGLEAHVARNMEAVGGDPINPIGEAQAMVDGWHGCPEINHGNARAYYTPGTDRITMPDMQAFRDAESYYRVLFHEMGHATGHRTRLARDGVVNPIRFASHDYSEEELVAEMTCGMLASHTGIASEKGDANSAAYLDTWLAKLKREPDWLVAAGGQAQKAADLIRGIKWEKPA